MKELKLNKEIETKLKAYQRSYESLKRSIVRVQVNCKHSVVYECDWLQQFHLHSLTPRRMCARCRREEKSTSVTGTYELLKNHPNRVIQEIDRDALYALRIPGAEVDIPRKEEADE